jgi:aldehyde dehydrogenase (NAD+)
LLGEVGEGNRKDIRNAVEAAHAAAGWGRVGNAHARAQILYYMAENLAPRTEEFAARIADMSGGTLEVARGEVEASIQRLFTYAAWADKWDGAVHQVPMRGVTLAMNEPVGVMGLVCPQSHPLLGLVSLMAPALAVGNTVVVIPSEQQPLAAAEFYTVLDSSDLPPGVVNIVTGERRSLALVLAEHLDVDGLWYVGTLADARPLEAAAAGNMKRTWVLAEGRDWYDARQAEGREFLRHATEVKNIWIPYGE